MELSSYSRQGVGGPSTLRMPVRDSRNLVKAFDPAILDRTATNTFPAVGSVPARSTLYIHKLFGQPDEMKARQ